MEHVEKIAGNRHLEIPDSDCAGFLGLLTLLGTTFNAGYGPNADIPATLRSDVMANEILVMGGSTLAILVALATLVGSLSGERVWKVVKVAKEGSWRTAVLFVVLLCLSLYAVIVASGFLSRLKGPVVVERVVLRSGAPSDAYEGLHFVGKRGSAFVLLINPKTASQLVRLLQDSEVLSIAFRADHQSFR